MTSFESDYNNGAHPFVLRQLIETNNSNSSSYGSDIWSEQARQKIRKACQTPDADIYFLVGGTQTNATVIDGVLTGYEGVIAVESGHINVHESGAVEAFGHKVITIPAHNGKMTAEDLRAFHNRFYADSSYEHMVIPGIVYITMPTELGTIYNASEIEAIYNLCQEYEIPLYIDGARLGYGLMSEKCDFDLPWLAHHCDVFYIGGTKQGALCGEAVVFPRNNAPRHFFNIIKQHGALMAKSRLAGVQFDALFTDNLYFDLSKHAINKAMQLRQLFSEANIPIKESPTNQQFVTLSHQQMEYLKSKILFETWEPVDETHSLCRFVTSWATTDEDMNLLSEALKQL
ncbi:beta-eliminating lyase-related protein [Prevotella sp. E13-17]|uniref:threonine aldolase family protein n=1 Tax=Prevotella sp. E13-17 TaxID=2913616 RepID=UPI001EDB3F9F|nr:beta-eliminating lyase-related protein [Prevotella sp. E13-17]UKK49940.1 beta-eliminating lyase-related protein [Prevotella sp. E13-17]